MVGQIVSTTAWSVEKKSRSRGSLEREKAPDVVADSGLVLAVRRLAADGLEAWAQVVDEASLYQPGRTRRWLKVKQKG